MSAVTCHAYLAIKSPDTSATPEHPRWKLWQVPKYNRKDGFERRISHKPEYYGTCAVWLNARNQFWIGSCETAEI
ncbi:hypothetical protein JTE90_018552 [Oedothorax gibbosus]|uniref:Uncharacterized protein n=1 Tax=Oedothorax gibbosus TaxID=931172 RepID=A0AAV6V6Y0_9ARAC|nr:hypothetical protein JTE90_018552 [Oedothorax gibbosus]